jgi:hypothetical protein
MPAGARRGASRPGRGFRAAIAVLASCESIAAEAAEARAETPAAVLLKGAISARGLPFFGPNAIGALYGEYLLGMRARDAASAVAAAGGAAASDKARLVSVWYTRESVVLSAAWKSSASYGPGARVLARPEGPALFLKGEGYSLFLELAAESPEARSFAQALNRKFAVFFRNAPSDAELSFPSVVEY